VDSSIGGKTGVDFMQYKNMVGAFYMPKLVYMNLSVLKTLPKRQISSGMGEIIKHGLIKDTSYFSYLQENSEKIKALDMESMEEIVFGSCEIKRNVVENDPKEQGERALLNFGHTLGHAVEKLKNFEMLHGQCVAVGSIAAMKLSAMRGNISEEDVSYVEKCFECFGLPTRVEGLTSKEVLEVSKSDKKMEAGKIKFVLLHDIGNAYVDKNVSDEELIQATDYLLNC
ncbi:MAG: 3-dehydroquinate synthase, partial [Lachnospiraceae bacterium]|nr:3-dehydroquinate synthase [Lachnospiraceae bacterium]